MTTPRVAASNSPSVTGEGTGSRGVERWFYINVALFIILLSAISFGPSIFDQSRRNPPSPLVMAHGILLIAWLLLFLTQAALVATRRTLVHRRLGLLGPVLAAPVIVLSYLVLIDFGRRGYDLSGDVMRALSRRVAPRHSPPGLLFPLAELLNFVILVAAGLWYRRRPDVHKRLMLMAAIVLAREPILHLVGHLSGR